MRSFRTLGLLGLSLLSVATAATSDQDNLKHAQDDDVQWLHTLTDFRELVRALPGHSLRDTLITSLSPKYQDGVFEHQHDAIERVHREDPELATRLASIAKQNAIAKAGLRKRQGNSTTTAVVSSSSDQSSTTVPVVVVDSTTTAVSFTTQPVSSTSQAAVASASTSEHTTVAVTTTNGAGSTLVTSVVAPVFSASTPSPVTTTNAQGSTIVSTPAAISQATLSGPTTTQSGYLVPVVQSSTNSQGSVVLHTTSAFETSAPTSVLVAVTTTNSRGQTITTSSSVAAAIVTSVNAQGSTITSASPLASVAVGAGGNILTSVAANGDTSVGMDWTTTDSQGATVVLSHVTSGQVVTTTDARGSVFVTTFNPGGGQVSQLVLETTRLPNGQLTTITSYAIVGGPTATSTKASTSGTGKPGLQSGLAAPTAVPVGGMVAALAVGAAALL